MPLGGAFKTAGCTTAPSATIAKAIVANPGAKKIPYDVHDAVKRCIENLVLSQVQGAARMFGSASARTSEDIKKVSAAVERLVSKHGFCPHCADELLREAEETQLWKYQK